jgi:hypothetical protein
MRGKATHSPLTQIGRWDVQDVAQRSRMPLIPACQIKGRQLILYRPSPVNISVEV